MQDALSRGVVGFFDAVLAFFYLTLVLIAALTILRCLSSLLEQLLRTVASQPVPSVVSDATETPSDVPIVTGWSPTAKRALSVVDLELCRSQNWYQDCCQSQTRCPSQTRYSSQTRCPSQNQSQCQWCQSQTRCFQSQNGYRCSCLLQTIRYSQSLLRPPRPRASDNLRRTSSTGSLDPQHPGDCRRNGRATVHRDGNHIQRISESICDDRPQNDEVLLDQRPVQTKDQGADHRTNRRGDRRPDQGNDGRLDQRRGVRFLTVSISETIV